MNWTIINNGIPNKKIGFLILCRNIIIPKSAPIAPPRAAKLSSVFSLILHLLDIARYLSKPYMTNATIEIMIT